MEERSHHLKHYLQHHKNICIEEMEVGMKVVFFSFKSAIERQISEAVAISREDKNRALFMNSKSKLFKPISFVFATGSILCSKQKQGCPINHINENQILYLQAKFQWPING